MSQFNDSFLGRVWMGGSGLPWYGGVANDAEPTPQIDQKVKAAEPTLRPTWTPGYPFGGPYGSGLLGSYGGFGGFGYGACGPGDYGEGCVAPGFAECPILSIPLIWEMRSYEAIVLAHHMVVGPIIAGERTITTLYNLGDEPMAEKIRIAIQNACLPMLAKAMPGACESPHFGNWLQEVMWDRKDVTTDTGSDRMTCPVDVLPIFPGEAIVHAYNRNTFTGFQIGSEFRDARYAFLAVSEPHIDRIRGYSRNRNALRDYWRAIQSGINADKIECKASGTMMLLGLPIGQTFVDDHGNPIMSEKMTQKLARGSAGGQIMRVPITPFSKQDIASNPELAKIKAVQIEQFEWGNIGPALEAHMKRMDQLDRNMIRAWHRPEREGTEGQHGTKAEAGAHAQVGITDSELLHQSICEQWDAQVVAAFVRTNFGEQWVGCHQTTPAPLADTQQDFLQKLYIAISSGQNPDPEILASIDNRALGERVEIPLLSEEDTAAKVQQQKEDQADQQQQQFKQQQALAKTTAANQPQQPANGKKPANGKVVSASANGHQKPEWIQRMLRKRLERMGA